MPASGFAVIDFETTGLFPGGHDRVIEIAVVHVDPDGSITGQWETVINPGRDLGPQHIHQIRAADVLGAPTFADIAPRLIELLSNRVIVAHNASFDIRFLTTELARLSYEAEAVALCTMQLAREYIPGAGRSLRDCCDAYGIEITDAHRASADALATAHLLAAYMGDSQNLSGWHAYMEKASAWPSLAPTNAEWVARGAQAAAPASFLQRISIKLPEFAGPAEHLDYLALLDRCLLDRQLSVHESNALVTLAKQLGIGRETCVALHSEYFDQLTAIAWADGELTTSEMADLVAVGEALGIPSATIANAMQPREATPLAEAMFALLAGDLIVLTGDMVRDRDDWHRELESRGFVPWSGVTKKVKLVAAADPDSLSGKARKARDYGIPIVDERGLAALLAAL